jgi:hypothetical protein
VADAILVAINRPRENRLQNRLITLYRAKTTNLDTFSNYSWRHGVLIAPDDRAGNVDRAKGLVPRILELIAIVQIPNCLVQQLSAAFVIVQCMQICDIFFLGFCISSHYFGCKTIAQRDNRVKLVR